MEYKFIDKKDVVVSEYAKRIDGTTYCNTKKKILYKTLLKLKQKDVDLKNIETKKEYQEVRFSILKKDNNDFNNYALLLNIVLMVLFILFKMLVSETYPSYDWLILIGLMLLFVVESYLLVTKYKLLSNYMISNNYVICDLLTIIGAIGIEFLMNALGKNPPLDPAIFVFLINYYYGGIAFQKTMKNIK